MKKSLLLLAIFVGYLASAQIQIKVTLSGTPNSVQLKPKNLKYGKDGAFCFIYDDRALSALEGASIMPQHTDGANNPVAYRATIASNGVTFTDVDFSANGAMTIAQLKSLIDKQWSIACHGYYHGLPSSSSSTGYNVSDNVRKNRKYHYDKLKALGSEFILRTGVVPSADTGYHSVWKYQGYLAGTSQNAFDTFVANPYAEWADNGLANLNALKTDYQVFARKFGDIVNQENTDDLISSLSKLFLHSTPTTNKLLMYGTHATQNVYLSQVLQHIKNNSNDKIWVPSMQELTEYFETVANTSISYKVTNKVITITLDQRLPDAARWRDISLGLITDKNIIKVEFTGADKVTFNASTGLINVFKQKTSGFADPEVSASPIAFTSFTGTAANNSLVLNWATVNNTKLVNYDVEKSTDSITYRRIATTNSTTYTDNNLSSSQYYRIKAVSSDSLHVYSDLIKATVKARKITVTYISNTQAAVSSQSAVVDEVYPVTKATGYRVSGNPVSGNQFLVFYEGEDRTRSNILLFNAIGQPVYKTDVQFHPYQSKKIVLPKLPPGIFYLTITDQRGDVLHKQKLSLQ